MQLSDGFSHALSVVAERVNELLCSKETVIVAIDGPCASGKTTFSKALSEKLSANIIHMDDFFLRPEQRTKERLEIAGENVDHERFLSEVLFPLSKGKGFSYRPYDCRTGDFKDPITVLPKTVNIVEGSYSCHLSLIGYYDLRIYLHVDPSTQIERIIERDGLEKAEDFRNLWIPLENKYFDTFNIKEECDLCFKIQ